MKYLIKPNEIANKAKKYENSNATDMFSIKRKQLAKNRHKTFIGWLKWTKIKAKEKVTKTLKHTTHTYKGTLIRLSCELLLGTNKQ